MRSTTEEKLSIAGSLLVALEEGIKDIKRSNQEFARQLMGKPVNGSAKVLYPVGGSTDLAGEMITHQNANAMQVENYRESQEVFGAVLEVVESGFKTFADRKLTLSDATFWIGTIAPISKGMEGSDEVLQELGSMSDAKFEQMWAEATLEFQIPGKGELTTDIKGIAKGLAHGLRVFARGKATQAA